MTIKPYDGMILTDAEADQLPSWMNDDNTALEQIATINPAPTPDNPGLRT
jgi:hypothetical protein